MTTTVSPSTPTTPGTDHRGATRLLPPADVSRWALRLLAVVVLAAAGWAFSDIRVNPLTLWAERDDIGSLLQRMWQPMLENPKSVIKKVADTFLMAFVGTALALLVAIPLGFMAAKTRTVTYTARHWISREFARIVIVLTRAIPELVLGMLFVRVYGIGVLAGVFALGIHSIGMMGKLFAAAIEEIEAGPLEGVTSTGASRLQSTLAGIVPQVVPAFIGVALYRLDINFRAAVVLGIVGAGGIGLDIKAHQGSLDYPQLLGVTLVIMTVIVIVEFVSARVRAEILAPARPRHSRRRQHRPSDVQSLARQNGVPSVNVASSMQVPWTRERVTIYVFSVACVVILTLAFVVTDMSISEFVTGLPDVPRVFARLIPRDLEWWQPRFLGEFVETVAIGVAATVIAILFAVPTGFLAARNVAPARWVYGIARLLVLMMRALPELIVAVIFVAALGLGPKPGVLALSIGLYAFGSKLFADGIEEISEGARDGVRATGASGIQEGVAGVWSQAGPSMISNCLYLFDISLRSSVVLGIVGAGGIGFTLLQATGLTKYELIGGLLMIVFGLVYVVELLSDWIRRQIL